MSELISLTLLIRHQDEGQLDRVVRYFEADTRPDFPEDVSAAEAGWVEPYEILPYPNVMERPRPHLLLLEFNDDADMGNLPEDLGRAVELSSPEQILYYLFIEDHALFAQWAKDKIEVVCDIDSMAEDSQRILNDIAVAKLRELEERPMEALQFLSSKLSVADK